MKRMRSAMRMTVLGVSTVRKRLPRLAPFHVA
jgi:hypothetical protein